MVDEAWVRSKSRHAIEYMLGSLERLPDAPCASAPHGLPLKGRVAFVVGAGPSLEKNGHLLNEAKKRGAVIAVNASAAACDAFGCMPDVVVCRETLNVSKQLAQSSAEVFALDVSTHPDCWGAAGTGAAWFFSGYPRHFDICEQLAVRPLFGGTSALCSAVALAHRWGAEAVALVGVDLMLGEDGAAYHPDAPRGDCSGRVEGDRILFKGNVADDELHLASGQPIPSKDVEAVQTTRGQMTTRIWHEQAEWLFQFTNRALVPIFDCTEGGLDKGILQRTLRHIIDWYPVVDTPGGSALCHSTDFQWVPSFTVNQVKRRLLKEADVLEQIVAEGLDEDGPSITNLCLMEGFHAGALVAEGLGAVEVLDAHRQPPGLERARATLRALGLGVTRLREAIGAGA